MGKRSKYLLAAIVVVISVTGCSLSSLPFMNQFDIEDESLVTDAKKRVIISRERAERSVCAEPSPDVASAFSHVLEIAGNLSRESSRAHSRKSSSANIRYITGAVESVAQLGERLAVIQLFRDRMYRACEAYANGAIDRVSYILMMARADKTMATLLATEMAAGAFGRSLAKLGGSVAVGGVDPEERAELQNEIVELTKELSTIVESMKNQSDPAKKTEEAKKAEKVIDELTEAHKKLLKLDLTANRIAVYSGLNDSAPGLINNRVAVQSIGETAEQIARMHQNFLDDPGLEPLTDACLSALSTAKLDEEQAAKLLKALTEYENAQGGIEKATLDEKKAQGTIYKKLGISIRVGQVTSQALDAASDTDNDGTTSDTNDDLDEGADRQFFQNLGITIPDEITNQSVTEAKKALKNLTDATSKKNTAEKQELIAETTILGILSPFAKFCLTEVFGELKKDSYIKTMLRARKELRTLDACKALGEKCPQGACQAQASVCKQIGKDGTKQSKAGNTQ